VAHTVVLTLDSDSRGSKYSSNSTLDLFGFEGGGIHSPNSNIRDLLGGEGHTNSSISTLDLLVER
jgi:hypothetical protein